MPEDKEKERPEKEAAERKETDKNSGAKPPTDPAEVSRLEGEEPATGQ